MGLGGGLGLVIAHLVQVDQPLAVGRLPEGRGRHQALVRVRVRVRVGVGVGVGVRVRVGVGVRGRGGVRVRVRVRDVPHLGELCHRREPREHLARVRVGVRVRG